MKEDFRISVENFEGPLELLLYLVRKKEVDVYDIPILEIVREYQEWVRFFKKINLDRAGEFSSMLATLMMIKSKMLLYEEIDDVADDPRKELKERLANYARFLKCEKFLEKRYEIASRMFSRPWIETPLRQNFPPEIFLELKRLMIKRKKRIDLPSPGIWNIENMRREIKKLLRRFKKFGFISHFKRKGWKNLVGAFFILLDMAKEGKLRIDQFEPFGEIWVRRKG